MSIFTFYPAQADGASLSFTAVSLPDDTSALAWAKVVAKEHPSCSEVVIWEGERLLGSLRVRQSISQSESTQT